MICPPMCRSGPEALKAATRPSVGRTALRSAKRSFRPFHLPLIMRSSFLAMREIVSEGEVKDEGGFWKRLRSGLSKTRESLGAGVGNLLLGEKEIDESVLEELETALLLTDVGVDATQEIMTALHVNR